MERCVLSNGVEVTLGVRNRIAWASDWAKLVLDHIRGNLPEVSSKFYRNLWGHTDYYLERRENESESFSASEKQERLVSRGG